MRARAISGLRPGDRFTVERTFTEADTLAFGDVTRDYNPVHYDKRYSDIKRFRDRICHGLLTGSMICEIGGQIGWLAASMNFRFKRPVYFGDTISCTVTILSVDERRRAEAEALYVNQEGEIVCEGGMTGIIPGPEEQSVMRNMVAGGDPTNPLR
jgi:acyl dehydratase